MHLVNKKVFKILIILISVLFLSFAVLDSISYARAGGGRTSGSSGFRSSGSSSGSTSTPYRSSTTQQPGTTQSTPQQTTGMSPGKSLLYGIGGGLVGGMLGNMLFGSRGNAGQGWGGGGGFGFGDFLIIIIILGIIYFVVKRYRAKKAMELSGSGGSSFSSYANNEPAYDTPQYGSQPQANSVAAGLSHIGSMDPSFNENGFKETVEDIFFKIQGAWTKRDLSGVRNLLTPDMLNTFQNDVNTFITNKQFNRLENIAVRQVDIVDAVQDQGQEYITIRFLASLLDYNVDEAGNTISGSSTDPVKFLEYWTFTRKVGERNWTLTAITQEQDYR
jgi:predicted lipid-binding transport protein (Tim44 family)